MLRMSIGIFLGAIAMYVFGMAYWMSGFPTGAMLSATDDAAAQTALAEYFPEPGSYFLPSPDLDEETRVALHEQGPVALVHVNTGSPVMQAKTLVLGFVHDLLTVLLIAVLLRMVVSALGSYGQRVGFVFLAGVIAAVWVHGTNIIWWNLTLDFPARVFIYDVVSWTVAGLVLAKTVRES